MAKPKKLKRKEIEELKEFNDSNNNIKKDNSIFVPQDGKLKDPINIRMRNDLTERQKAALELINDKNTKVVFIDGPPGVSKTFLAVLGGLQLLNNKKVSQIIFTRVPVESASKGLGYTSGSWEEKYSLYCQPLFDKLSEFLDSGTIKFLEGDGRIKLLPLNYARGLSVNAKYIIVEEAGQMMLGELETMLTRIGQYSKIIVIGDKNQTDIKNSGFKRVFEMFDNEEARNNGIFSLQFTSEDIVRSGVCRFIVETFEKNKKYQ